jgi:hypothetical protein
MGCREIANANAGETCLCGLEISLEPVREFGEKSPRIVRKPLVIG